MKKIVLIMFLLAAFCAQAATEPLLLKLARVLSYQQKYAEATVKYQEYIAKYPKDHKAVKEMADIYFYQGDFKAAAGYYSNYLENEPNDIATRIRYAQILSYDKNFDGALKEYDIVLQKDPNNLEALEYKADILSWDQRFAESIEFYDKRLALKPDKKITRQKARVLGWWKRYDRSLETYGSIDDPEGEAKKAYWNKYILTAIKRYDSLLETEPDNVEARFDLAQTEAYQHMWNDARSDFEKIVQKESGHFRAGDSLKKLAEVKKISVTPGAFFFRARSPARDTYINKLSAFADLNVPVNEHLELTAGYDYDQFFYPGTSSVKRNQAKLKAVAWYGPYGWLSASFLPTVYSNYNRQSYLFDGSANFRPFDPVTFTVFTKRDDLYNNKTVFENRLRTTDLGGKFQADIDRRWTLNGLYQYSWLSDTNRRNGFTIDNLVYLFFEPKRLTIDVAFDFYTYKRNVTEYFSPHNFWDVTGTIHWRHYMNENGMYYGAKNYYYGIKYKIQVDSQQNLFNGGALELYRDLSYDLSAGVEAFGIYAPVYYDIGGNLNFKYSF